MCGAASLRQYIFDAANGMVQRLRCCVIMNLVAAIEAPILEAGPVVCLAIKLGQGWVPDKSLVATRVGFLDQSTPALAARPVKTLIPDPTAVPALFLPQRLSAGPDCKLPTAVNDGFPVRK